MATLTETMDGAVSLSAATKLIPSRPSISAVWRWATKGVRGHKLATYFSGGRRVTTPAAIEDFLRAINSGEQALQDVEDAEMGQLGREAGAALERLGA